LASTALTLIGTPVATTTAVTSSNANANLKSSVTLTASVTGASGTPMGTVTFLDGTTALGTGLLSGSSTVATASISTSSLQAGTHSITVSYAGVNGYLSSTSQALSEVVVAPAYSTSALPSTLTVSRGGTSSTVITLTPVGGYVGSFTLACGTLPAHFSCMISNTTLNISTASQVSTSVTLATDVAQSLAVPAPANFNRSPVVVAFAGLPLLSFLAFSLRRRGNRGPMPKLLVSLLLLCGAVISLGGCGNPYANDAAVGTYSVPILITPAGGAPATITNISVTVQ
jgi:hypothetical protein